VIDTAAARIEADVMISREAIQELADRIAKEFRPERIILFGSHAHGRPTEESDVDLLVVLPFAGKGVRKSLEILDKMNPPFSVDLLARTPEVVRQRLGWNDFFLREIHEKGVVLYEAPHV